jgi:GNAT superfamily N-acetyltransferase
MTAEDTSSALRAAGIVEYFPADDDAIFRLQHRVYPGHPLYRDKDQYLKFWRWWFWEQPWRKGRVFGIPGEDGIAGLRPLSFLPVSVKGRRELCGFLNATVTHPAYRRRGVFSRTLDHVLDRAAREEHLRFAISFPNDNSYPLHLRNDRIVALRDIPLYLKLLDPRVVFRARVRLNLPARLCLVFTAGTGRPHAPDRVQLRTVPSFDGRFDAFWERVRNTNTISIERTGGYLNWRYLKSPYGPYTIVAAEERGSSEVKGYIVAAEVRRFGLRLGLIADVLVDPECPSIASALIGDMLIRFKSRGIEAAGCLMYDHHPVAAALRERGFVSLPARLSPKKFHLTVSRLTDDEALNSFLADHRHWYVTWGDTDNV